MIGAWRGVALEVAAWDGASAEVDLSVACMFSRELSSGGPAGGLLHLDQALNGALTRLRTEAHFRAEMMETLLIPQPHEVAAKAVLLVGLGEPEAWTATISGRAVAAALRVAVQLDARTAAFAPSVLDSGLTSGAAIPEATMQGVLDAIDTQHQLVMLGLAEPLSLRRWVFDVGAPRFDTAVTAFSEALGRLRPSGEQS